MNELSEIFLNISDNQTVLLEKNKVYHVYQDDSFESEGYYCSNTAKKHENPNGLRRMAIFLKNKKNIVIDGNGATILVHGKMTPIVLDKCENIVIRNMTVDYACPTMSEFKIISNNDGVCVIKINSECLYRIEYNDLIWQGEYDKNGVPYWEDSYIGNRRHIKLFDPETKRSYDFRRDDLEFESIEQIDNNTLKVELKNKSVRFPAGSVIQTRNIIRDQTGSLFQRCKNLSFENLRIKFMHGLGMVSQFCENVSFINCDLTPSDDRTIVSTADFFQFSGCRGDIKIQNCKANGAHDDYINVHGTHLRIVEKDEINNSILVRFMHNESWGFQAFEVEDVIDFIKWDTLQPFYSATVTGYKKINDTDILLYLDKKIPDIELNKDVVENATWTPNLYVNGCEFGQTSGRGILCTTRGEVVIENNVFNTLWGPALLIEDDCNFWFESGLTREIIFRNNTVIGCDYHETYEGSPVIRYTPKVMDEKSTSYVHEKLTVTGNTFKEPCGNTHLFLLEYVKDVDITDNTFDTEYRIKTKMVKNIVDRNNKIL